MTSYQTNLIGLIHNYCVIFFAFFSLKIGILFNFFFIKIILSFHLVKIYIENHIHHIMLYYFEKGWNVQSFHDLNKLIGEKTINKSQK